MQEVMDLSAVAHLSAIKGRIPFLNFFDGFRTSHEVQKVAVWDFDDLAEMCDFDAVRDFRAHALNPEHPAMRGSHENGDIFFQNREACNKAYDELPAVVEEYMKKVNEKLGTNYDLFNYYGAPDAERVIVAMGSICDVAEEVIDYLNAKGEKVGLVKVRLYRPFVTKKFVECLPETVKKIAVLDRTKEPGSTGEPLYLDVVDALNREGRTGILVTGGRYGLGSKDTPPSSVFAIFTELAKEAPRREFTVGIVDDVTNLSLPEDPNSPNTAAPGTIECKFWGLGGDGTVGANKNSVKIIGDHTEKYVQAYFQYDSKKTGGVTISHLRFGDEPIRSSYYINKADFVACHNPSYIQKDFPIVYDVKPHGTFMVNCQWTPEELAEHLSPAAKRYIAQNDINLYTINAIDLAVEIGMGKRTNTILQSAFFALANIIPQEEAIGYMKDAATKSYLKKGQDVVDMNHRAIDAGATAFVKIDIPADWATCPDKEDTTELEGRPELVKQVREIMEPVGRMVGDSLPVSVFADHADGQFEQGASAYEKRGVSVTVAKWDAEKCTQCNSCSFVCPHATIRPFGLTDEEVAAAPAGLEVLPMKGKAKDLKYTLAISPLDCMGCGVCVGACPSGALSMVGTEGEMAQQSIFDYCVSKVADKPQIEDQTLRGSQFKQPLLEFSGACGGCGETPYAKLVTQLFGNRMYIANATGCSSIWANSSPSTPYTVNAKGQGPAWSNSLFEDAAEFGYGMLLAQNAVRGRLKDEVAKLAESTTSEGFKAAAQEWLDTYTKGALNGTATDKLVDELGKEGSEASKAILDEKDFLAKKSQWIFGGDGWAYDIGFGGVDHVLASGKDVNVLVFDTEVYSNTGGQSSKSTPTGAVAQFASGGKKTKKKDLASIAMSYGYVYVAQIAMGADYNQTVKAIAEAEAYDGPSLIIAYAPCINHGIKAGMGNTMQEEEKAVKSGYWHLFRYNPELKGTEKGAFTLDSKAPTLPYQDFLNGEVRYNSLRKVNPEMADALFAENEKEAAERYEYLNKLVKLYGNEE